MGKPEGSQGNQWIRIKSSNSCSTPPVTPLSDWGTSLWSSCLQSYYIVNRLRRNRRKWGQACNYLGPHCYRRVGLGEQQPQSESPHRPMVVQYGRNHREISCHGRNQEHLSDPTVHQSDGHQWRSWEGKQIRHKQWSSAERRRKSLG